MGAITDQVQHDRDVAELRAIAESIPVMRRHLSHHLRNPLGTIMGSCELATRNLEERNLEALQNDLARINAAVAHMRGDIEEAGL